MKNNKKNEEKSITIDNKNYIINNSIDMLTKNTNRKKRTLNTISESVIKENTKDNTELEVFSMIFNRLLIEKGFTQSEFAKETGISTGSISKFRNGLSMPKRDILEIISNKLGVTSNYLLGKSEVTDYDIENINKKIGLSQNAIETLYKLQHDYFVLEENVNIDIKEQRKISKTYNEELKTLSLIIEHNTKLLELLDYINQYKNNYIKLEELKKTYKETKDKNTHIKIIDMAKNIKFLKFSAMESLSEIIDNITKGVETYN